ncbi:MAG: hypothetical protein KIT11_01540 [Fimbriimonadaceae bacterium]|nr:hypothetical protein [Fimbriimonadaceae bacterium]QYK54947.1 MAG: hypothetical protein KF733_07995 [Fimbriimonadaceae bacterium]
MSIVPPPSTTGSALVSAYSTLPSNRYGRFSEDGREFVLCTAVTPRPWVNVMSNGSYSLVVSQAGGGFSWLGNSQIFRLTRWEQDMVRDDYGRWIYLREGDDVWATTLHPTQDVAEVDEITHGLGYSVFCRQVHGIESRQTVFVAHERDEEIWILELENKEDRDRELVVGPYLEWQVGSPGESHREFHRLFVSVKTGDAYTCAWKRASLIENTREESVASPAAFLAIPGATGIDWFTDKANWVGAPGDVRMPAGLWYDKAPQTTERWDDPVAAARFRVALAPGERQTIVMVLGVAPTVDDVPARAQYWTEQTAREELARVKASFHDRWNALEVSTPDPVVNALVNAWLPHQAYVGRMQARSAYYQQGGAYGFRDQLQDSLCFLDHEPHITLRQIETNAEAMYEDGGVRHWWHPGTMTGHASRHSDTCMWLAQATLDYLDETADFGALDHTLTYLSRETELPSTNGTLLDHCLRGLERALSLRSERGIPLIGAGDWNDGLSHAGLDGKGESVWDAMFLYSHLTRFVPVLKRLGDTERAARYRTEAENIREAVEQHGWDGAWFIAGTNDTGAPFGSSQNSEGQIFLNPQTWAVISGIAEGERLQTAMQSARDRLFKEYGALLLAPAYKNVDPYIGYITRYAPGLRENGGVYSHAATWAVQAAAMMGDADEALQLFLGLCPPLRSAKDADLYAAEPYVMPGNSDGPDSPFEGRAGWTWYTGSAAWLRRVAIRWLCGVRATLDGLVIDPNLPSAWDGFTMRRPFRGDVFEIAVSGTAPYQTEVDGKIHEGGPIRESGQNLTRTVCVKGR